MYEYTHVCPCVRKVSDEKEKQRKKTTKQKQQQQKAKHSRRYTQINEKKKQ